MNFYDYKVISRGANDDGDPWEDRKITFETWVEVKEYIASQNGRICDIKREGNCWTHVYLWVGDATEIAIEKSNDAWAYMRDHAEDGWRGW